MAPPPDQDSPAKFADRVDDALEALWHGDSTRFDSLLVSDDAAVPAMGELLEGAISDHAQPLAGLPRGSEIPGYEILGEIGRGGMGVVYKARQLSTKRVVALKVMLAGPFASKSGRRRFQREVELTARLQHAGIVRVLEAGEVSTGQPYYAMDYVGGVPLGRWLSVSQPGVRTIVDLFCRLCEAVEYAHEHNVIHRDLKPGNVLIDDEGEPHILDFGLAKATDAIGRADDLTVDVTSPGQVVGTLRYLSPEQAAGTPGEVDARTDVYAVGVMLFEALTGSLPYKATGTPSDVTRRILEEPPVPPSSLARQVDRELETIILKALEKDKARRYRSAQELGEDLRRYLEGEPILAKRPSTIYRLRKKGAKHRMGLLIGLALLIAAGATLVTVTQRRHRRLAAARWAVLAGQRELEAEVSNERLAEGRAVYQQYPDLPEARLLWAQTQFRVGLETGEENWCAKGIRILKEGLEDDSSAWVFSALLADMLHHRQDPEWERWQAEADRDAPDTSEAWYLRTYATLEIEEAKRYAEGALKHDPEHALARRRLADLYLKVGDYDKALRIAREAEGRGAELKDWKMFQGYVHMKRGGYAEAGRVFTELVEVQPMNLAAHRQRAVAYMCLGEYDKAIADYTACLALKATELDPYWDRYYRATPLWITGRRKEAADDYRRFRSLRRRVSYGDARLFFVLHEEARALDAQGHTSEADQLRREARTVLETSRRAAAGTWLDQIFACLAGEHSPEELVAAADPQNPEQICESQYYAGEVSLLRGQLDEARSWFQECLDTRLLFDPSFVYPLVMSEYHLARWRYDSLSPDRLGASLQAPVKSGS